jgi:sigma-B regulation protein RsbU (phosphoserine phosphatase)
MTDPNPQGEELTARPAETVGEAAARQSDPPLRLVDLIDLETLQAIQDGFAELAQMATSIRDDKGRLVTRPSRSSRFCDLLGGAQHDNEACSISNYAAAAAAKTADAPVKYVCHAGLVQFAASIRAKDRLLGTIVLGDLPERPILREEVARLALAHHTNEEELWQAAQELPVRSDANMRAAISFLQLFANTLTRLCYQQVVLQERIDELTLLAETSSLLSSTLEPDLVLDNIVRTMAEVMNVKACSLRLLNETGDELVIKATYGLSKAYLKKGPVIVAENPHDQEALRGQIITIPDMRTDPRVRYPEEARREGLVSSLAVGLIARGKPLGTLHIYTDRPHTFPAEEIRLFRSIADQAAATVYNAQLVDQIAQTRQQQRELALASQVQRRLLPARPPKAPGYDFFAVTVSSQEVGGDLHDWIELPKANIGIAVGDVAGKGVPAAILMASLRAALRAQAEHVYELGHIMDRVNQGLTAETEPSEFATLFYGVLDTASRRLTYSTAGHEPPVLLRGNEVRRLAVGGPLLGVDRKATYAYEAVALQGGDVLVAFSDGAFDATNFAEEHFGRERLLESIRQHAGHPAERMVQEIRWDIRRFTGLAPRADDMTLLVVKVLGP